MERPLDLDAANAALSVTIQKQQKEIAHLRGALECARRQLEDRLHLAAHQTITVALEREIP